MLFLRKIWCAVERNFPAVASRGQKVVISILEITSVHTVHTVHTYFLLKGIIAARTSGIKARAHDESV